MNERKKRNLTIGILCGVLLLMGIGYATFSTILNINGTAKIKKDWNVYIDTITATTTNGNADGSAEVGSDKLSATFLSNLRTVGDYVEYTAHIVNAGTMAAELSNATIIPGTTSEYIEYEFIGLDLSNNHPVIQPNGSLDIRVRTTYVHDELGGADFGTEEITTTATFQLTFVQYVSNQNGD